jgi:hypothetical protein
MSRTFYTSECLEHDNFVEANVAQVGRLEACEYFLASRVRLHEQGVALEAGAQGGRSPEHCLNCFPEK